MGGGGGGGEEEEEEGGVSYIVGRFAVTIERATMIPNGEGQIRWCGRREEVDIVLTPGGEEAK